MSVAAKSTWKHPPVGVGILGAGRPNIATANQLPACLASERVRVVALCDRLPGVHEYAAQCGARAYTDYADMLADPEVEMIQIATPDWCHVAHAEAALAAGKHVLLQKPPCVDLEGIARLRQAVENGSGRLKVLLNNRHRRTVRTLHELVAAGEVGRLAHIRISHRGHRYPISDPASPYLKAEMGGVWIHNGLHWLDEACVYANALPVAVQTNRTRNENGVDERLGEGANYWCGMFRLGKNVTFTLEYNTMLIADGLPSGMQRVLIGTQGELRQTYGSEEIALYRHDLEGCRNLDLLAPEMSAAEDVQHSFAMAIDDFAAEIREGGMREPTLDHSLTCMTALIASGISSRVVDPSKQEQNHV